MPTPEVQRDESPPAEEARTHGARTTANWALAGLAVLGAFAVVGFAYLKVLGTAACTDRACGALGPGELGFSLILYGTPIVAVAGVLLSFRTARRRLGVLVPIFVWTVVAIALVVLVVTF